MYFIMIKISLSKTCNQTLYQVSIPPPPKKILECVVMLIYSTVKNAILKKEYDFFNMFPSKDTNKQACWN